MRVLYYMFQKVSKLEFHERFNYLIIDEVETIAWVSTDCLKRVRLWSRQHKVAENSEIPKDRLGKRTGNDDEINKRPLGQIGGRSI